MDARKLTGEKPQHAELSAESFRLLVDAVQDYAIFLLDTEGNVATWNTGAQRIKGFAPDEIIGQHFSRFYSPEDNAAQKPQRELELAGEVGRFEEEGWRYRKNGSRFWAGVVITALFDDKGSVRGYVKVTRDLTERKVAEESLRESEQRFRLLVESLQDYAIFMLDTEGYVASWNVGAQRIKGYSPREAIGQHFSIFYAPEDVAAGKPDRELEIARATGRMEDEGWRVRKDGSRFWANVIVTALRNESGRLTGFGKVTRDLTERRLAEERRERFIANAAHELRTPVASITGFSELLTSGRELGEDQRREALAALHRAGQRLAILVEQLLDLTLLEQAQADLRIERVGLLDAVRSAIEWTPTPAGKSVQVDIPGGLVVDADPERFAQILANLMTNAYRYGGNSIHIGAEQREGYVAIIVTDDGEGVPQRIVPYLFEPFTRAGTRTGDTGSGLGLSIVRWLVEAHGGSVAYEPNEPTGSRFTVTLRSP